jgi:enamine deaminase RidA (YjgF/YER057c/UK114 family)
MSELPNSLKHVTAKCAKSKAQEVLGENVKNQIVQCLAAIDNAVSKNRMEVTVDIHLESLAESELVKRGFKVENISDQRDGDFTTISW